MDDLDEQVAYALDRSVKVGPHGYSHGWIFVGAGNAGDVVHHPEHGRGLVTRVDRTEGQVHVRFSGGPAHIFQHQRMPGQGDFKPRASAEKPSALNEFIADRAAFWGGQVGKTHVDNDLDEQVAYLTHLTKSVNPVMAEQAREALDRLATATVVKVGPKGYTHGWVFVGAHDAGERVNHPELGHGTVTRHSDGHTHVRFDSGAEHIFERHESSVRAQRGRHMEDVDRMDRGKPIHPVSGGGFAKRPTDPRVERGRQLEEMDRMEREDRRRYGNKSATINKVGPKGYIHGWIFVGAPGVGARVHHPTLGHGTVTRHEGGADHLREDAAGFRHSAAGGRTHIRFDSGAEHSFEHGGLARRGEPDFKPRAVEARGRNLTAEHAETERIGRQASGEAQFHSAVRQATRANAKKPMTDKEFVKRAKRVEEASKLAKTHATDVTHKTNGEWNPERAALHKEIVDSLYAKAAHVPNEGKAVIAGGLGGAGKSTVLAKHAGIDAKQFLTVNPDDIKEEMAKRGMVPDVPGFDDLSPMERATFIHEESGDIAQMLADKAYRDKKNMIWDITMSSGGSVQKRIDALHQHGYGNVRGVFVHIPAETSVERAMARYRRGVDDFRAGKGHGGRYVPPHIIRAQKTSGGSTVNREVFDKLKPQFDDWSMYDNSGSAPTHIESKG